MRHRSSCSSDYGLLPLNGQHEPLLTTKPKPSLRSRRSYHKSLSTISWDNYNCAKPTDPADDPLPGPGHWEFPHSAVRRSQVPSPHHIAAASEADFVPSESDDVDTSHTSAPSSRSSATTNLSMKGQAHTGAFKHNVASEYISALVLDRRDSSEETDVDEDGEGINAIFLDAMGKVDSEQQRMMAMEHRLVAMDAKMAELNGQIRQLTQKNLDLEASKLRLLSNTANALNQYRDTVRKLNQQNATLVRWVTRT